MAFQHTVRHPVSCSGVGLHSGVAVKLRILPAAADSGIVFRRTDLDGYEIEATGRNVAKVSYATSLMKKGVLISTTEHMLSAFIGIGLDNAVIELDNLELPILDGSAKPFVDMVMEAGLKEQRKKRMYMRVKKRVEVTEGVKQIAVEPSEGYSISYKIDFPEPIGASSYDVRLMGGTNGANGDGSTTSNAYCREIAPARTFGFLRDEQNLRNMGLIRGASAENAIIVDDAGVKNPPLRFPDEFVRHKVLDLIGDLALLGHRIQGRVVADRAGHAMHTALVSRLLRDRTLWEPVTL